MEGKKVCLITGGSSGIGRAIGREMAENGYFIINCSRREEPKEGGIPIHKEVGGIFFKVDFSEIEQVRKIVDWLKEEGIKVDVLVNNVGFMFLADDYTPEMWDKMITVNLKSHYFLTLWMIKEGILEEKGVVIFISSGSGIYGEPDDIPYGIAKAGLIALMKGLVRRYKERKEKFRFVTIAPGVIDTWLCGNPKENPVPKEFLERIALGRIGKPEEVARLVRHIVENEFLNGCVIEINGGKV